MNTTKQETMAELLEGALREVLGDFRIHSPQMSGKHVWALRVRDPTALKILAAAIKEQEG